MAMEVMARYSIPVADRADHSRGVAALRRREPADLVEVSIVHADGTRETTAISSTVAEIIEDVLNKISEADHVTLLADNAELSPEDAATILGVSRPLVRSRMDAGALPFRRVGAHRRIRLSDILELKRREASVRSAFDELRADTDELMANGL